MSTVGEKYWGKFNAVDLVTIATFAALFRIIWYMYKMMVGIIPSPWTDIILDGTLGFAFAACIAVVRKPGTAFLYSVAWMAINFFLQGEILYWWLVVLWTPDLAELYMWIKIRVQHVPQEKLFNSFMQLSIIGYLYVFMNAIFSIGGDMWFFYIPYPMWAVYSAILLVWFTCLFTAPIGARFGLKIKTLIG